MKKGEMSEKGGANSLEILNIYTAPMDTMYQPWQAVSFKLAFSLAPSL